MRYTVQFFIAGYGAPEGGDVEHADSKKEIGRMLQSEHDRAESYGAAYEPSEALIWRGHHDDVTDIYPDASAVIGPRGGVQFSRHA